VWRFMYQIFSFTLIVHSGVFKPDTKSTGSVSKAREHERILHLRKILLGQIKINVKRKFSNSISDTPAGKIR
ncbi:MAG: hypothetical protein K2P04_03010, partial [Oscillospiraceae bacterium]|nr:hypothetical protein [Oscillospiraceae bacterium]